MVAYRILLSAPAPGVLGVEGFETKGLGPGLDNLESPYIYSYSDY